MAVSFVAAGAYDFGGPSSTITPEYPAGLASGDLLILVVENKYPAAVPSTPSGWTAITDGSRSGGSGASGADSGDVLVSTFYKLSDGTETGTLSLTVSSVNSIMGVILAYRKTEPESWVIDAASGTDTTAGTSWSVTTGSLNTYDDGMVVACTGYNADATGTWSSHALTQSGATIGTTTERLDNRTSGGNASGILIVDHVVTAGQLATAATFTSTASISSGNYPAGATVLISISAGISTPPIGVADALIEVDVTNDPRSGVTTWTDITSYVQGAVTIVRGRQDELSDQLNPATCTLTLRNLDGRFTPDLGTGPYGTGWRKGIQIRVSVELDSITYRRFRGYVDEIDGPTWPGGATQWSQVTLTCSDELAQWSKGRKFRDVLTETILADNPDAYYPLTNREKIDESGNDQKRLTVESRNGGGSVDLRNGLNDRERQIISDIAAGVTRELNAGAEAARNWRGGSVRFRQGAQLGHNYLARQLTVSASTKWALGAWVKADKDTDGDGGWVVFLKNGTRYLGIGYNGVGAARASVYDATNVANVTGPRLTNGDWHHVFVHYDRAGNIELFVNGRSKGTVASYNFDNSAADHTLWIGSGQYAGSGNYSGLARGNVAHVTVYSGSNADDAKTNIADHFEAGWNGFVGARTGEMLERVVNWMQYPGGDDIARGVSIVGDGFAEDSTALEYAQLLIDSEAGSLYTQGDGTLVFHDRAYRYDNTSAVLTIDAYHDVATQFRTDDQYLVNKARYITRGGARGVSTAAASISDYGPYVRDVETLLLTEDEAEGLAKFATFRWKTPNSRLVAFPVDVLTRSTSTGVAALTVEIDDRITMTNLPDQAPAATVTGYVEGWTEVLGTPEVATWTITFNTSPTYTISDSFVLDSASNGELDLNKVYY